MDDFVYIIAVTIDMTTFYNYAQKVLITCQP